MQANLFFDFDMTLGYRILMWTATVRELLLEHAVVAHPDRIRPFTTERGYPWNHPELSHVEFFGGKAWWQNTQEFIINGLIEGEICSPEVAYSVAEQFPARYCNFSYWRLFPDSKLTLEHLKSEGFSLHLLSNHVPEARGIIDHLGILDLFDGVTISAEAGFEKPHPKIFEIARAGLSGPSIMIGDNYRVDVLGANAAGMQSILVREPNAAEYKYYCKDFSTLPQTIQEVLHETR